MDLNHLEALLKIIANGAEILLLALVPNLLLGGVLVFFLTPKRMIGLKLAAVAIAAGGIGLVLNDMVISLVAHLQPLGTLGAQLVLWLLVLGLFLLSIIWFFGVFFLPSSIAFNKGKHNTTVIILMNLCLFWIPFVWPILLFLALKDEKA